MAFVPQASERAGAGGELVIPSSALVGLSGRGEGGTSALRKVRIW